VKKRTLTTETKAKILKSAADILRMHGGLAGDRICQDWSGSPAENPKRLFSDSERDDIEYNHQIDNSGLGDYIEGYDGFGDEMAVSFTMADALSDMADEYS